MNIAELRRLEAESTPAPWGMWAEPVSDKYEAISELTDQVHQTEKFVGKLFLLDADGKCPASTGCGQTSEANAALIVAMRNALPELLKALEEARTPRPKDEWHEDYGDVVWWARFEGEWIGEAAWIGTPNDSDWSGHHTHWTPHPAFPLPPHGGVDVG